MRKFNLSIGAGEIKMQEALVAQRILQQQAMTRHILQQQASNKQYTTVASDSIHGGFTVVIYGHDLEDLAVPVGEFTDVTFKNFEPGESGWLYDLGGGTFVAPLRSRVTRGMTDRGETFSATVTSDQIEDEGAARLRNERGEIFARLEDAKFGLGAETYTRLKRRLNFLFEPDDGQDVRISPGSMRQFLQFMQNNRKLRFPAIVITDKKNVKAIWRASESEIFWIEFEPNGDVTYLAFFPNDKRSDGIERTSALSTAEDVSARAKTMGALGWMRS